MAIIDRMPHVSNVNLLRYARCWGVLVGTGFIGFGVHDVLSFEALPKMLTPENVGEFFQLRRHFGAWPGWVAVVLGTFYLVAGLLRLRGWGVRPLPDAEAADWALSPG